MRVIAKRSDSQVRLRIPQDIKELLKHYASDNGRSLNAEILSRIKSGLKEKASQAVT